MDSQTGSNQEICSRNMVYSRIQEPSASEGSAVRLGAANSPATNLGHAAAAIIAALSVESARVGKAM